MPTGQFILNLRGPTEAIHAQTKIRELQLALELEKNSHSNTKTEIYRLRDLLAWAWFICESTDNKLDKVDSTS